MNDYQIENEEKFELDGLEDSSNHSDAFFWSRDQNVLNRLKDRRAPMSLRIIDWMLKRPFLAKFLRDVGWPNHLSKVKVVRIFRPCDERYRGWFSWCISELEAPFREVVVTFLWKR
ncbi:MAG: hypothetical protein Ta2E_11720 [Mycoplasmoidaceae bacterium]|nr:MAG: hypothetical protein Ta2E_11720 [Mycoplasmoidaceae bacterium]